MVDTKFEKNLVINNRELKYKGIFRASELFQAVNQALEEREYEKREKKSEDTISEEGRKTYVELRPFKEKTSYVTLMLKIKISLDNMTEVIEEVNGKKGKFQQGDILIVFDAWSMTEYANRWTMSPVVYFLKGVINKYVYTWPLESGFTNELVEDTAYVYAQVKKHLNSYHSSEKVSVKEEDIVKDMEKEIREEVEKEEGNRN